MLVYDRNSQVTLSPEINWSNPITKGLLGAFLPTSNYNIVDKVNLIDAGISRAYNSSGIVISSNSYLYPAPANSSSPEAKFDSVVMSAVLVTRQTGTLNADYSFFRSNGSSNATWGIGLHSGTLNGPYVAIADYSNNIDTGISGWTLSPHNILITGDGSNLKVWVDGGYMGGASYGAPVTQYNPAANRQVFFGVLSPTWVNGNNRPALGLYWNRALSQEESRAISRNPWVVFKPVITNTHIFTNLPVAISSITLVGTSSDTANNSSVDVITTGVYCNSDVLTTGWQGVPNNTNKYSNIDEVTASSSDFVMSPNIYDAGNGPLIYGLNNTLASGTWEIDAEVKYFSAASDVKFTLLDSSNNPVGDSGWIPVSNTYVTYTPNITTTGTASRLQIEVR